MPLSVQKIQKLKQDLLGYIQAAQYKKAEKLYQKYKKQEISDVDIWRYFAGVQTQVSNFSELAHCCNNILKALPDDFQAIYTLAVALQNTNQLEQAIDYYERSMAINPDFADAAANCARLLFVTGDYIKSSAYYQRALKKIDTVDIRLQYAEVLMAQTDYENALLQLNFVRFKDANNKKALFLTAQCCYEQQNYVESEKYYLTLLNVDNNNINVINNLGRLYEEAGNFAKATEKFQQAIDINDNLAITHLNLGKVLVKTGDFIDAENEFLRTIELEPKHPEAYFNIGKIYSKNNEIDTAKKYFLKALDSDISGFMAKADEFILAVKFFLSNLENPELFSEEQKAFVAGLFDSYADKFDKHLVDGLQYKTPEYINDILSRYITKIDNVTIDLGCGTGLCCKYLKKLSSDLIGVDLSAGMIKKAQELDCYDNLVVGEITEVVNELGKNFDLIVAADVFVYIASLSDIFHACSTNINKGGYYIFSTESLPENMDDDYRLFESARYKHSNAYINRLAEDHGFELIEHMFCTLRKENNADVKGCVTILQKM